MGIVINKHLDLSLGEVLEHMEIPLADASIRDTAVFLGGPVQPERGFVLHVPTGNWDSTLNITDQLGITTSRDIMVAIANCEGPGKALIALGYAGWGPGQLEQEIADNAWLSGPADHEILFDLAVEKRWEAAAALMGVDLNLLPSDIGHA
jgi:putative transcriptional regulator